MSNKNKIQPVITPVADAMWAKITEPATSPYNSKAMYSMDLVFTPEEAKPLMEQLTKQHDSFYDEIHSELNAAKQKSLVKTPIFKEQVDKDGNLTGNLVLKTKQYGHNIKGELMRMPISDSTGKVMNGFDKLVGNGSKVRAKIYPKPYHMNSTNSVGISMRLNAVQIIELNEYSKADSGFDNVEGGYSAPEKTADNPFTDEDF